MVALISKEGECDVLCNISQGAYMHSPFQVRVLPNYSLCLGRIDPGGENGPSGQAVGPYRGAVQRQHHLQTSAKETIKVLEKGNLRLTLELRTVSG